MKNQRISGNENKKKKRQFFRKIIFQKKTLSNITSQSPWSRNFFYVKTGKSEEIVQVRNFLQ
jgi:hypothetical protein